MDSKCSSEQKSPTSLIVNQKLEMIKFSEEGVPKSKIGRKLDLLWQILSLVVNTKEKFFKEIRSANPMNTWMIRKWNSLLLIYRKF